MLMSSKVSQYVRLQLIMIFAPLIRWYCDITYEIKKIRATLPQGLKPTNLVVW